MHKHSHTFNNVWWRSMCDELKLCLTDRGWCFWSWDYIVTSSRHCFGSQRCGTKGQKREKNISSSNWTPPLDLERDWGKDKRLWPGQENSLLNLTHMLWANGVVAQGHRQQQQQQHVKKVFHPDLTSNLREGEEERERGWTEMTERLCVWGG